MAIRRWASDSTLAVLGSTDHRSTEGPTAGALAITGPILDGGIATGDWRAALLSVTRSYPLACHSLLAVLAFPSPLKFVAQTYLHDWTI